MAIIECNEINQTVNELLIAFADCNKIKNEDLRKLVDLVQAVSICSNGGANYNTEITEFYEPVTDLVVSYPVNSYHSISIMVISGFITETVNSSEITYPKGTVLNTEVTTLNQTVTTFKVKAGANVIVKYLIETV